MRQPCKGHTYFWTKLLIKVVIDVNMALAEMENILEMPNEHHETLECDDKFEDIRCLVPDDDVIRYMLNKLLFDKDSINEDVKILLCQATNEVLELTMMFPSVNHVP